MPPNGLKQMINKRKITLKVIGYEDVESYVRTLVSEGLGQQIEDTERSVGHSDDSDANAPVLERINPTTEEKPRETLRPHKRR
jgi:hypothetical protein